MDPIIHINKVSPFKPSFPLFDISLLTGADIDFNMSDLISLDQISKKIQERLVQDISLDDGFDLFSQPSKEKFLKSEKKDKSRNLGKKLGKKKNRSSISVQNKV